MKTLFITALPVASNRLTFIYAVNTGTVLQARLGYYICPMVNVLPGIVFLKEKLLPIQILSVLFAEAGSGYTAAQYNKKIRILILK